MQELPSSQAVPLVTPEEYNKKLAAEIRWLQENPHFNEKPASVLEFLGPQYLNIESKVRPGLKRELVILFGEEVNPKRIAVFQKGMFTGAIGIGKTTLASIILPYMAHWVLCLKDPQDYYGLLPGSRIAFMQMSTSEDQAVETIFGDIKARVLHSKWFQNFPFDPKFTKQIRFAKDIWILPGNSAETTFEGYNILAGILDEADSHKQTKDKDYADVGYDAIENRISSRFDDQGFLLVIGQMKKASGFAKKKYDEFRKDPQAHTVRMTIWESFGWDKYLNEKGERDSFWYDAKRKQLMPEQAARLLLGEGPNDNLIEVPNKYLHNFKTNPEKALRDLAGIPPNAGDAFISLTYKIDEAVERWQTANHNLPSPVSADPVRPHFENWFRCHTPLKRAMHIDFAYSADGDALGLAMGHVKHIEMFEGEEKPYISFDFLLRMKAAPGTEIMFSDVRRLIYDLKDELGFRIRLVTMDGFQSTDTRQQLRKRRIQTDYISVDKSKLPYEDLRDAIYENRIEFPPYITKLEIGSTDDVMIAVKELMELEEHDKKVDHPVKGSKDVADAMAGVVHSLMGDRTYRRGLRSGDNEPREPSHDQAHPQHSYQQSGNRLQTLMPGGLSAPVPPTGSGGLGSIPQMPIPPRLQPGRDR